MLGPLSCHPPLGCGVISTPRSKGCHVGATDFPRVCCALGPSDCMNNHHKIATTSMKQNADYKTKEREFWLRAGGRGFAQLHVLVHWHPMSCCSGRQSISQEGEHRSRRCSKLQQNESAVLITVQNHILSTCGYAKWQKQVWSLRLPLM